MNAFTPARRKRTLAGLAAVAATACGAFLAWGAPLSGADSGDVTAAAPDLAKAAWVHSPDGSPTINQAALLPSAVFPTGVTYPAALRVIYEAGRTGSALPSEVEIADALPAEVVVVEMNEERLRISLTAPFGWTADTRRVRPASIGIPGHIPWARARMIAAQLRDPATPLPDGVVVDVPRLEPCQVAIGTPHQRPSCE